MDQADTGPAVSTETEDRNDELGQVMAVIVRLRQLRHQGFDNEEIARHVAVDHPQTPGGGTWSAAIVDQVLRVADSSELELRPPVAGDEAATGDRGRHPSPGNGRDQPRVEVTHPPTVVVGHSRPVDAVTAPGTASDAGVASETDPPATLEHPNGVANHDTVAEAGLPKPTGYELDVEDDHVREPASRSVLGIAIAAFALAAAGAIAYHFVAGSFDQTVTGSEGSEASVSDEARTAASQALSGVADEGAPATRRPSVESTTASGAADSADGDAESAGRPPLIVDIGDLPEGDPADTMTIRVEGDDGDTGEGRLSPATATIRNDGKLHVEGAFPSHDAAEAFVARASRIFGREALVESYSVDPDAPQPAVSDVALDKPVLFESGSATIHPDYIPFLQACAGVLEANSHIVMSVSAYTDSVGDEALNLELSQKRARAIIDFYRDLDIDEAQLIGTGFGEERPVADNASPQGREENRRAMLQLLNIMDDG